MKEIKTPECDRLKKVAKESQSIGAFIEWMKDQGIHFAKRHEHTEVCGDVNDDYHAEDNECGYKEDELVVHRESIEGILARYFDIDLKKIEEEKRAILAAIREDN